MSGGNPGRVAHALIVTPTLPPVPGRDMSGIYWRLGLFVAALSRIAERLTLVHFGATDVAAGNPEFEATQSRFWGVPVSTAVVARRTRQETFRGHYLDGVLSLADQKAFFPFLGADQTTALRRHLDAKPDLVLACELPAMTAVLRTAARPHRLFFDITDVLHHAPLRAALTPPFEPGKTLMLAQSPAIFAAERQGVRAARLSFIASDIDRRRLRRLGVRRGVVTVPNATEAPAQPPPICLDPTVLYLGNFEYGPNVEAAERLARHIMPQIRSILPQARLLLAGKDSLALPSRRAAPDWIEYLGFVEDLPALYARARIVCCPLRNGAGTRVKLVEAAAYGKPMVATRIGAEGLAFRDGEAILLRDHDTQIANACVSLLRDDATCTRLGAAARATMLARYLAEPVQADIARRLHAALLAPEPGTAGRAWWPARRRELEVSPGW